jgi:hypothetical protein
MQKHFCIIVKRIPEKGKDTVDPVYSERVGAAKSLH